MQTIQNSSIQTSTYRDLPLTQLQESLFNPRKRFEQTSLEELAQSIRAQGVLAPLLVRELEPERFEIVAGSRRFRASQIAGLEQVPVRIVTLSDAEAQLAMAVENLQRQDVHPLEEARAFANLLQHQYDIATIAAKVGRSERFDADRKAPSLPATRSIHRCLPKNVDHAGRHANAGACERTCSLDRDQHPARSGCGCI
jgi:ParB family chromosome partitioning protein